MTQESMEKMQAEREEYIKKIMGVSSPKFDPEKWESLREQVYSPSSLNLDVVIDDTTLREGLQMAGTVSPLPKDECKIACMLRDLGVERIEVLTFAKSDQEAIKLMQNEGLEDMLAAWCRAAKVDVDAAVEMGFKQVGISHPVSYIHFQKWPEKPVNELLNGVVETVEYARDHGLTVFVHGEDSTRADWNFEREFINAVADAGAKVYRICDTVGCGLPDPSAPLPMGIPAKIKKIKDETRIPYVEIHAHDDLGNAVNNTMAGIRAASGLYDKVYASTTFLGIGDRAGNAETEKIMMNCYLHHGVKKWNLGLMRELATFISSSLKYQLPVDKAIVGEGAFTHESGIHVHGIMTLPLTYEVFPPELVGQQRTVVIGKRSGKHGIRLKISELTGKEVSEDDPRLAQLVELIKTKFVNGSRRYPIKDEEFEAYARKVGFEL